MNLNIKSSTCRIYKECIRFYAIARKFPINHDAAKDLPVFKYPLSKSTDKRVYVWGHAEYGALGILNIKEKKKTFIRRPHRLYFGEKHTVSNVACGMGFTVFSVVSNDENKVYGTGINTDSQMGYHPDQKGVNYDAIVTPQPINLRFEQPHETKVLKVAAGRAHALINTDEGLFTLGNNAFGQCGREIIEEEKYSNNKSVYIHKIRHLDGKSIADVFCGLDHSLALTVNGEVYSCGWSADGQTGLGSYENCSKFTRVNGDISKENIVKLAGNCDTVLALNDKGDVFAWGNAEYFQIPVERGGQQISTPVHLKICEKLGKIVDIAAGNSYCIVLNDKGEIYVWGYGLLGTSAKAEEIVKPTRIPISFFGNNELYTDSRVVSIYSGTSHMGAVTKNGDLFVWGRNNNKCLGLGFDQDQNFPLKVALNGTVENVSMGFDHTVVLCKPFI